MVFVIYTSENLFLFTYCVFVRGNMRDNRYLHTVPKGATYFLSWCLFATTLANPCKGLAVEQVYYDSSLQRSNFLSFSPSYEKILEEQIKDRRSIFLWRLRFDSEGMQTAQNINSQIVGATGQGRFVYKLMEDLSFNAKVNLRLRSGRTQDLFGDLEPTSGIYPREINLKWTPFKDRLTLRAGQIHQNWFNEPMFLGNLGFPGLQQILEHSPESGKYGLKFITQQLIPTSSTLSSRVADREPTPQLYTSTLQGTYNISSHNFIMASATHYNYSRLPHVVASDSFIYGNSVANPDPNSAEFDFDFNGYFTHVTFEQKISHSFATQVQWSVIKNLKAPDELGEAQAFTLFLYNDFGPWIGGVTLRDYFIEGDAVPAAYNSHLLGHNNREGQRIEVNLESKDWGVIFRASYTKADLLSPRGSRAFDGLQQDDQQTFYFAVETMYDFI